MIKQPKEEDDVTGFNFCCWVDVKECFCKKYKYIAFINFIFSKDIYQLILFKNNRGKQKKSKTLIN